jgi:hypothetical protein
MTHRQDQYSTVAIVDGTYICLIPRNERLGHDKDSVIEVPALPLIHLPEILNMIQPIDQERETSIATKDGIELGEVFDFDFDILLLKLYSETSNLHGIDETYHHIQYPTLPGSEAPTLTVVHVNDTGGILVKNALSDKSNASEKSSIKTLSLLQRETKLEIENRGAGFLIGDFLGINAWEQILVLPHLSKEMIKVSIADSEVDEDYFKQVLSAAVLVDDNHIHYGVKSGKESELFRRGKPNGPLKINVLGTDGKIDMERVKPQKELLKVNESGLLNTQSTLGQNAIASIEPKMNWQKKVELSLEKKVDYAVNGRRKETDIELLKQRFLHQSRKVLEDVTLHSTDSPSSGDVTVSRKTGNSTFLDIIRIRCLTRPIAESSNSNGLSLQLNVEVDIMSPSPNYEMEKEALYNVQLSCSLGKGQVSNALVEIQSGMVPTLPTGNCVTVMAIIRVTDVILDEGKEADDCNGFLVLSFGAIWQDEHENKSNACGLAFKGSILASMSLGIESFLFHQDSTDLQLIDFSDESDKRKCIESSGIFEYRSPSNIIYDVSNDTNVNLQNKWEQRINALNEKFKGDHQIDCIHDGERMLINLTIFSSSLERRVGKHRCIIFISHHLIAFLLTVAVLTFGIAISSDSTAFEVVSRCERN